MQRSSGIKTHALLDKIYVQTLLSRLARVKGSGWDENKVLLPGTRVDLIDQLNAWTQEEEEIVYWLRDVAGAGKSTLAGHLAQQWHTLGILGACFFFARGSGSRSSIEGLWSTIAAYLFSTYPPIRRHILHTLSNNPSIESASLSQQLDLLVVQPLIDSHARNPRARPIIIVFDALDECDARGRGLFLNGLDRFQAIPMLKILVTSRMDATMPESANVMSKLVADVEASFADDTDDIEKYLEFRLKGLGLQMDTLALGMGMVEGLAKVSGRLFIWAKTAMDWVEGEDDQEWALESLVNNPTTVPLDDIYLQILQQAYPPPPTAMGQLGDISFPTSCLQVLLLAIEPLSTVAVAELLGTNPLPVRKAFSKLRSLFNAPSDTAPIFPTHPTVREFFLDPVFEDGHRAGRFHINSINGHFHLALYSFKLMKRELRCDMLAVGPHIANEEIEDLEAKLAERVSSGLCYASTYWMRHARRAIERESIIASLLDFCQTQVLDWTELLSLLDELPIAMVRLGDLRDVCEFSVRRWLELDPQTDAFCSRKRIAG